MLTNHKRLAVSLAAIALGLGAAGIATGATEMADSEPLSCEIQARQGGGMTAMRGVVHADEKIAGTYQLHVQSVGSGGSSNISQGGRFEAGPDEPAYLGQVTLGGAPAYEAELDIDVEGTRIACSERFEDMA